MVEYMDELRISNIARWTHNFSVPTKGNPGGLGWSHYAIIENDGKPFFFVDGKEWEFGKGDFTMDFWAPNVDIILERPQGKDLDEIIKRIGEKAQQNLKENK